MLFLESSAEPINVHTSMKLLVPVLLVAVLCTSPAWPQPEQAARFRAPATPLVAADPYFSIWSMADRLTDDLTRHWTGKEQALTGIVRVDGKNFRFLGNDD